MLDEDGQESNLEAGGRPQRLPRLLAESAVFPAPLARPRQGRGLCA